MTELRLAEGEEVVRRYSCTAVDNCAVFAGTVIPKGSRMKRESQGTITVTNRRVIYDMEASGKQPSSIHQETRIDSISSVSSIMAKFGRDLRVPILMVIVGFILIFAPYVYAYETDVIQNSGDYIRGYNDGVEYSYYQTYLEAIESGDVDNTIPTGYVPPEHSDDMILSSEYERGFSEGILVGANVAESDLRNDARFSVPTDHMKSESIVMAVLVMAVVGAVVFVMGSVLYAISSRTKDWILMNFGSSGGSGVFIKSMSSGDDAVGIRPLVADDGFVDAVNEIGAVILENRSKTAEVMS